MKSSGRRLTWIVAATIAVLGATVTAVYAQRIWAGFYGRTPPKFPTATTFDGNFHFCRVMFMSDRREKQGWSTDYPGADINLSVRLSELTKIRVTLTHDGESEGEVPDTVVVRLTDDALFQCPFAPRRETIVRRDVACLAHTRAKGDTGRPTALRRVVPSHEHVTKEVHLTSRRRTNRD